MSQSNNRLSQNDEARCEKEIGNKQSNKRTHKDEDQDSERKKQNREIKTETR